MTPSPLSRVIPVPLFSQADNSSGEGWRECMSSSCAMIAAFYKVVSSDDQYNRIRSRFGATTNPLAQVAALKSLGLSATFVQDWDRGRLDGELKAGRPVAVGWLHHGPVTAPVGGGHWSVVAGWSPSAVWMLDPFGEADLRAGGYESTDAAWVGWYSWRNWGPRWDHRARPPAGQPSRPAGWAITVRPSQPLAASTHGRSTAT
jgi:hypothetical protein